jgi:hypothetical protein
MVGAGGGAATVNVLVFERDDSFPEPSLAVATAAWMPCMRGTTGWQLKVPAESVVAAHTGTPSTDTVTVVPGSAVPENTGVEVLVVAPPSGVARTGAPGGVASMVKVFGIAWGETFPAASVAVAVTVCEVF